MKNIEKRRKSSKMHSRLRLGEPRKVFQTKQASFIKAEHWVRTYWGQEPEDI
jgi:hypothetical protein